MLSGHDPSALTKHKSLDEKRIRKQKEFGGECVPNQRGLECCRLPLTRMHYLVSDSLLSKKLSYHIRTSGVKIKVVCNVAEQVYKVLTFMVLEEMEKPNIIIFSAQLQGIENNTFSLFGEQLFFGALGLNFQIFFETGLRSKVHQIDNLSPTNRNTLIDTN